uniref:Uncharacterized protein n=1 Tax=Mastacembelus armatus TaxID=205130 RepID=A0A3Q3N4F3_9TELE
MCRIGAITRGFLTRRLLKTEKVKHLRQTVVDTQEFIRTFQTEAPQKKCTYSPQDLSLQERVKAQLRAALYDIHDIFFEMPLGDRLALLQQDRELRAERKLRDMVTCYCNRRLKRRNINPLNAVLFSFPRVLKPSQASTSTSPMITFWALMITHYWKTLKLRHMIRQMLFTPLLRKCWVDPVLINDGNAHERCYALNFSLLFIFH